MGGALALELLTQKPSYNKLQIFQGIGEGYYKSYVNSFWILVKIFWTDYYKRTVKAIFLTDVTLAVDFSEANIELSKLR